MTDRVTVMLIEDPEDPDQLLLDLGLELCDRLGWQPGDKLEWSNNTDGSWNLRRINQS